MAAMISYVNQYFVGLLFSIATIACSAQKRTTDETCNSRVEIQIDKISVKDRKSNAIADPKKKSFIVKFMGEFNDSIFAYVNDGLQFADFVLTNKATGESTSGFGYDHSLTSAPLVLKVVSPTRKSCFKIDVKKKYRIIYIFIDKRNTWIVRFSDVHYLD